MIFWTFRKLKNRCVLAFFAFFLLLPLVLRIDTATALAASDSESLAQKSVEPLQESISTTWYFAEGYTGAGFQEWLCLLNPNSISANVTISYMYRSGGGKTQNLTVGPNTRETIDVNEVVGPNKEVSMKVTSDQGIVAERPMYFNFSSNSEYFNFSGINGGHDVMGATSPSTKWYFAEGCTGDGFQEWLCLLNPNSIPANVTIYYTCEDSGTKTQYLTVGANTRETVDVNGYIGRSKQVSIIVTSDEPIVAERPMYFNFSGISGGHVEIGALWSSNIQYFAEGYTGVGFQEWLCLLNPNSDPSGVLIDYRFRGGGGKLQYITVGAYTRKTVNVNAAVGPDKEVSAYVSSNPAVVVERSMYFNFSGINGGHDIIGPTSYSTKWYFAEGYTGDGFQEWLCLLNPCENPANVTIDYTYRWGGGTSQNITIGAETRQTINVNSVVGPNKEVSIIVTSDAPVVAERPMYFNFAGINGGHVVAGVVE